MRSAFMRLFVAAAATAITSSAALAADAPARIPRLPDGKPNFNGIWQTLNTANFDLEPHAASAALAMVPGQFVPVPAPQVVAMGAVGSVPAGLGVVEGDEIPYKPEALEQKKENQKNWLTLDPEIKCYLPGVPRATYMPYPFQIFQSKDYTFIAYEYAGATRNIYMKDPGPPPADSWMGQSVGRWEGDTLVVDVDRLQRSDLVRSLGQLAYGCPEGHGALHDARSGPHLYEATITDPNVFTKPWKISMPLYRRVEAECATAAVQVRRIRGRTDVRPSAQEAYPGGAEGTCKVMLKGGN